MEVIKSVEELKRESMPQSEFKLLLNYGVFSRKTIEYDGHSKVFLIHNHIDDTEEEMTEKELSKSLIGKAIKKGAFVKV